jgi:DNA (cytosine-5)-methyltransferase 1
MTHGSLSTGIGGFDIGAKENGIETKWTCEIDPLRQDILKWLFPNAKHYGDMREVKHLDPVDIISFGFPCQDISIAKRKAKGIDGEKSNLWYEGWRIIRRAGTKFIIIENSPMLLHRGLTTILGQLAKAGYNAEWKIISCKRFGLPSLRKRLFVVAYSTKVRRKKNNGIFDYFPAKVLSKSSNEEEIFQSEFNRIISYEDWREAIGGVRYLDDGIPKNILYGLLAAAGDTVSPRITSWIFSRIKEVFETEK